MTLSKIIQMWYLLSPYEQLFILGLNLTFVVLLLLEIEILFGDHNGSNII